MKFKELYQLNNKAVKSSLISLWCSEASSERQKAYADQLKQLIENELFSSKDYDPLVQSMEPYVSCTDEEAKDIFQTIEKELWKRCIGGKNFNPYKHQVDAWKSLTASDCRSMVVTTGTGSGKTECFMVPLVNELKKNQDQTHSVKAIFLYPLNALMEDQKDRLQKLLDDTGLRFAVYNGNLPERIDGHNNDEIQREHDRYNNICATRQELHRDGADIILTNPTMLEYMLIRDTDQHLLQNNSLRWVVIDEAHTFTGAAAAELALLLRRVLNAFDSDIDQIHFAASSATIGNEQNKEEQERSLRKFISDLSGIDKTKIDIIRGDRVKFTSNDDSEFCQCKKKLCESTCDYIKLQELLPNYSSIEERLSKLDEFCEQGLRAKVHFFYRVANNGIRVQLDNWKDKDSGILKLLSQTPKDENATPALELVRCKHCGEYFAIGEYKDNDPSHYMASSESDNDAFDLSNSDKTRRLFFGIRPSKEPPLPNNQFVSIDGNNYNTGNQPAGEWALVVNTNKQCPHCSKSMYNNSDSQGNDIDAEDVDNNSNAAFTQLRISASFIGRLMSPGILDCMTEKTSNNEPHKGQQYLSFVDSRQAAARGTFEQNKEVEKEWVYSRVYHKLLELYPLKAIAQQKQNLEERIEKLENEDNFEATAQLRRELRKLNEDYPNATSKNYLEWMDVYNLLNDDLVSNVICRQFANNTSGEEVANDTIVPIIKERYIFAVMLSYLAKYPPFQASAETMGLFASYYPKLDAEIIELPDAVNSFNKKHNTNITLPEWKNLLKIYLDRIPRSNESIYLRMEGFSNSDIFNCSERFGFKRPPHRTARKPYLNDDCSNASLIPYLLAKIIEPNATNLLPVIRDNRESINGVIDALWNDLTETSKLLQFSSKIKQAKRKKTDGNISFKNDWEYDKDSSEDRKKLSSEQLNAGGHQLRLNIADIAFKLPETVYYSVIPEKGGRINHIRPTYTTFCGYAPYKVLQDINKPIHEETWTEQFPYTYGTDSGRIVYINDIVDWMTNHRKCFYDYGLMGETGCFNNRILSVLQYPMPFIQAEHTAQVNKKLSRRTQELFKNHQLNILACSTTMEMGVDLGDLELVMMASIPPHPANYKQRAGRSGRNDQTRSACITLCSSDAVGLRVLHDPMLTIIQRPVSMPFVDLECPSIIQRHVNAFLYRKSGVFFRDANDGRSSLNWRLIDVFSRYRFGVRNMTINGRRYTFPDYWTVLDTNDIGIYPIGNQPLGQSQNTRFEQFALWLQNDANPQDVEFLLAGCKSLEGCSSKVIDKCLEEWNKRYSEIENELSYYGQLYDDAYRIALNDGSTSALQTRQLDTPLGFLLRAKYNGVLKKRLIDYLATHRFTPNANMPVDVIEFDIYHNNKSLSTNRNIADNPSYSLQQALSQYAPGNMVVKENRVIQVAGVDYLGRNTDQDRLFFYTDGRDVVTAGTQRSIPSANQVPWPVNGRKQLELIQVRSFIPDINESDKRMLEDAPFTRVNAQLIGAKEWESSQHHLANARCNLDAGEAQILYYNDGIGYGYCMCPKCGKMVLESRPLGQNQNMDLPREMTYLPPDNNNGNIPCHFAIDKLDRNGNPDICIPNRYYRNVIIGGLIQTDFCEMRIKKIDGTPISTDQNDKNLLITLGLVICQTFTEHIGKDRNSVDFTITPNGNLCIFDTNPGGSGYSNKLSESEIRRAVFAKSQEMLDSIHEKEDLLDKFTVRYLNNLDIPAASEWLEVELASWDNTPQNVKGSEYANARWSSILEILEEFKKAHECGETGVLFSNDNFDKWYYESNEPEETRSTWKHRIQEIVKDFSISGRVNLLITSEGTIPTSAHSLLPNNDWLSIYTTEQKLKGEFYPLAKVNNKLYFTDNIKTATLNGEWAKGDVFCIEDSIVQFEQNAINFSNSQSKAVFFIDSDENKCCNSDELANIVFDLAKTNGLDIDGFFNYCRDCNDNLVISYTDEHLKSVLSMIASLHFIDRIIDKTGKKDAFYLSFINEKYYNVSSEINQPWRNIEKWERRNDILEQKVEHWLTTTYGVSTENVAKYWENNSKQDGTLPHWRSMVIECGNKRMIIYPHGGIINEWRIDFSAQRGRRYTMDETTDQALPLMREKPIMYVIEIEDKQ